MPSNKGILQVFIHKAGRRVYRNIPSRYRLKVLYLAYRNIGFLFRGMPHYENWRSIHAHVQDTNYSQNYLVDIGSVQQARDFTGTIAVHLHIFYRDLVKEFAGYMKNMPFPYDLFVSIADDESSDACKRAFDGLPFCRSVRIERVANRGRDIAPMLCTFGRELSGYDCIAHLHTKKSLFNEGATEGWREYLCESLFGSKERIRRILTLLHNDPPCGIVYPQCYFMPYWANTWLANREIGAAWCARLCIKGIPRGYFNFPVGTMFWARSDALAPLFNAGIAIEDFPEESGQTDGTLAHCLERMFALCSLRQGMPPGIIKDDEHPSWSAWRFDQYTNRPYESMAWLFRSQKIRLIAFDIFDTLFCRPLLDPETIKQIVSRRAGEEAGRLYREYRAAAEGQAREMKGSDVGLDEIYARLGELTGLSEDLLIELRHMEVEVEAASLEPRHEAIKLYKDALASGKPVVLITDMFLPQSVIEQCLRMHGIEGWQALFVSSEVGLRKDRGRLYEHVLSHYGIRPEELLMVGDNERSDIQIPCDMGASFLHLFRPVELARGLPRFSPLIASHESGCDIDAEITLGLVVRRNFSPVHFPSFDPDSLVQASPHNLGYSLLGPLLTSFAQWLLQKSREDGVDRLYFLSREGKIMKQVYDCWAEGEQTAPKSDYLVLSRRAAGVAAISTIEDILDIARTDYLPNTAEKFLRTRYGITLSDEQWKRLAETVSIGRKTIISVQDSRVDHLIPLLQALEPDIHARIQAERPVLLRYLAGKGMDKDDCQALVDIGYGGSVQGSINKLLQQKVHGYYLMTVERAGKVAATYNVIVRGCLLENVEQSPDSPVLYRQSFDLEKLLSADEPQVEYYGTDASGNAAGRYRGLSPAETACADIRRQLREGTMEYVRDAQRVRETMLPDFQPSCRTARVLAEAFLAQHSQGETDLLSKIVLDDHYCGRDLVS